jgi:hypothetical protein
VGEPAPAKSLYLIHPAVDFFFMGGLALLLLVGLPLIGWSGRPGGHPFSYEAMIWVTWVANNPHFAATLQRLYRPERRRRFFFTATVLPAVVTFATVLAFAYPIDVAPYFVKIYTLWAPYHFAAQTLGLVLIYFSRAGLRLTAWERRGISWFLFALTTRITVLNENGRMGSYFGVDFPRFTMPDAVHFGVDAWLAITAVAALVVVARIVRSRRPFPLIALVPIAVHLTWFTEWGRSLPNYIELMNALHSLQYLLLVWAIDARPLRGFLFNVVLGALLFRLLPVAAAQLFGVSRGFSLAVIWSGLQVHHYLVDGVVWRLRDTEAVPIAPAQLQVA